MKYLPASTSSVTLLLQPVVAARGAWIIFSESLSFWQSVGGGIVLLGIALCHDTATHSAPMLEGSTLPAQIKRSRQ
jgi:drug/metabolite transporter (DMT)-like permease